MPLTFTDVAAAPVLASIIHRTLHLVAIGWPAPIHHSLPDRLQGGTLLADNSCAHPNPSQPSLLAPPRRVVYYLCARSQAEGSAVNREYGKPAACNYTTSSHRPTQASASPQAVDGPGECVTISDQDGQHGAGHSPA